MEADVNVALNNIQNIKTVNIEGVGTLKVRRMGAGEELDLSRKLRRLGKVIDELSALDFTKYNPSKPEDLKKINKLTKKAESLSEELSEIKKFEFETYKRCMSDDSDGRVVDVIMNTLTDTERAKLFKIVFGKTKQIDTPGSVKPEEKEDIDEQVNS